MRNLYVGSLEEEREAAILFDYYHIIFEGLRVSDKALIPIGENKFFI